MAGRRAWLVGGALRLVVSHRGALHSGLVAGLLVLGALVADHPTLLAGSAGWVSHIALDMLNRAGVPLLWPSRRRFWVLPFRTGGIVDRLILLGVLVALVRLVVGI
jgi:inner membrane protein